MLLLPRKRLGAIDHRCLALAVLWLADVDLSEQVVQCEAIAVGITRGSFRPETWERLTVEFCDDVVPLLVGL